MRTWVARRSPGLPLAAMHAALFATLGACGGNGMGEDPPEAGSNEPAVMRGDHPKLLIIGQDLGAIRGYMASGCCPRPDGLTAYIDFFDLFTPDDFGGLGLNTESEPINLEFDWNAGPVSAWKTATEFGVDGLAIGLSMTENEHPGGLDRLASGELDDHVRQLGRFFSMIPGPVYLRIGYEFDGARPSSRSGGSCSDSTLSSFQASSASLRPYSAWTTGRSGWSSAPPPWPPSSNKAAWAPMPHLPRQLTSASST